MNSTDQNITVGPVILSRYGTYTTELGLGRSTAFAHDREMYVVGVYGEFVIKRFPSTKIPQALGYINFEIDATTGDVVGMFTSPQTQDPAVQQALATLHQ